MTDDDEDDDAEEIFYETNEMFEMNEENYAEEIEVG